MDEVKERTPLPIVRTDDSAPPPSSRKTGRGTADSSPMPPPPFPDYPITVKGLHIIIRLNY